MAVSNPDELLNARFEPLGSPEGNDDGEMNDGDGDGIEVAEMRDADPAPGFLTGIV